MFQKQNSFLYHPALIRQFAYLVMAASLLQNCDGSVLNMETAETFIREETNWRV